MFNLFKKKEKPRIIYETIKLVDTDIDITDKFDKTYKRDYTVNDDYSLSAKELKEDYLNERVYKYDPYELPFKMDGMDVYSQIKDQWIKVGRVKKTEMNLLNDTATLLIYPGAYKYVREDRIEKGETVPYFAISVMRKLGTVTK